MTTMRRFLAVAALALGLAAPAAAQPYFAINYDTSAGTATLRGNGGFQVYKSTKIVEGDSLVKIFDIDTHKGVTISTQTTFTSSATITGGGGLAVTYGVTAATGAFTGGGGLTVTYGITATT